MPSETWKKEKKTLNATISRGAGQRTGLVKDLKHKFVN